MGIQRVQSARLNKYLLNLSIISRYTSIGDKTNTIPNPNLKVVSPDGTVTYLPAYKLVENADKLERAGRN